MALADDHRAGVGSVLRVQAVAQITHDLVVELLAAAVPASGAGELFDATAQSFEPDDLGRLAQLATEFGAQPVEKQQLETFTRIESELAEVGFRDRAEVGSECLPRLWCGVAVAYFDAEAAKDSGQGLGKFTDGNLVFALLDFEIVEDGMGSVLDHLGVEHAFRVTNELDGHEFGGARNDFAVGRLEEKGVGMELDHGASSRVFTA